ncbi:MAG: bifunctional serine/threonine-protein kinase/formylglycine-generating enzyme family protein, partial [Proteobacteria bacterium]|nr:bifunctional serine/threonine-protein kinase/formylglycine-generating enzyme family protein [Pseudomonadota bacterium]
IKQRFKLEKVLGIGGMGKVYKALDLLKAEAKDKKPHVAIKLLNEDFKDHPEAFISLQRESSRQQKLAHPNIATIYDFDRVGGPGTPVFITMELMEGMELKDYIKKKVRPAGGLPFDEAYDIIRQLGLGLIYAHERRLVHSDFKPGNAFLCNDGTVKTLDFGIARAVKIPVTGEAEKTLFDPGKLGALTPAYASLEMLEGDEPDTRDDTYALGCTAYELLTGKHPFNKLPANKASENNLVPPYIKTLNKKQNRALRRAVAFYRADRSPDVGHFLEELEGKATWHKNPFVIAAAVLLVIGMMLIAPAMDYLHQKELEAMIAEINSGGEQVIVAKLDEILLLEKADQATVTDEAKDAIQNYFSDKVASLIDTSGDDYNFPAANAVINEITKFYPGSIFLQEQTDLVVTSKKQIISDLNAQYITALKDPSLIDNTKDILNTIKRIDPTHPLLEDPRPSNAYRLLALEKFEANDFDTALELVKSGMVTAKDDPRLTDLETKILRAQKVAQLESDLSIVQGQLASLTDFKEQQPTIVELSNLKPDSEIITTVSESFKPILQTELETILKSGSRTDAEALAADFGDLMNGLQLSQQLTQVKLAHLTGDARKQAITELVTKDINNIETALADAQIDDPQWETGLLKDVQELGSLVNEDESIASSLEQFRGQIADLYIAKANETLQAERFDAADSYVDVGERFAPGLQSLLDTRNAVASAREESDRKARVEANKSDFKTFTDADNVVEAEKLFEQLKADLPETDNYIAFEAPQMLGNSFARLAQSKAETKDFTAAYSFVSKGLEIDPKNALLGSLKNEYQAEANIIELSELFKTAVSFPVEVRLKVSQIENANPARYAEFSKAASQTLADRINTLRTTDETAAAGLANAAAGLFPANAVLADLKNQLQLKPWEGLAAANAAVAAGKLSQATELQQAAAGEFAGHPDFINFSQTLETKIKEANAVYDIYLQDKTAAGEEYEKVRATKNLLARAQGLWTDSPDYSAEEKSLDELIAKLKPKPKPKIRKTEEFDAGSLAAATPGTGAAAQKIEWKPIASDAPCEGRLAGYGKRAKAICFDMIHSSARGPLMVVVPDGEGFEQPFAIAKYEISVSDWSKYCILSGACKPIKDKARKNEPMTGITLQQAQQYATWLSERTGKTYRIPTKSEWEYAANAGGKQPNKDFNCRVSVGEKLIKGTGIVSVKSGKSNGWGLKNYVGNVQEWVTDGNSTSVRGGAFTDAHSKCDISLERSHDGGADDATGFRLILEEVG